MGRTIRTLNLYFEDFEIGDRFVSPGRTVTEADIALFAGLSGDYTPVHVDSVAAMRSRFGGRIAHGGLTLAIASGLEFSLVGPSGDRVVAFYGLDGVRFVRPVRPGDTVRVIGEVVALEPRRE